MKKLFTILLFFITTACQAQNYIANYLEARNKFKLNGFEVAGISNDSSNTLKRFTHLITEAAAKKFVIDYIATHGTSGTAFDSTFVYAALATKLSIASAAATYQPIGSYLTSFTETDPIWSAVAGNYRTKVQNDVLYYPLTGNPSNFLTSFSETDPVVKAIDGIVKSNGTSISAAVAGTDYLTPTGSAAGLISFPTFNQNTTGTSAGLLSPFTVGATSVTATGTQLNYLNAATGITGTASTNLVFSNSPTLVTPILGTPTSITLTNGTGLPISTGVNGLGTGVATFLATPSSANLRAAITDETGGAGLAVFNINPTLAGATFSANVNFGGWNAQGFGLIQMGSGTAIQGPTTSNQYMLFNSGGGITLSNNLASSAVPLIVNNTHASNTGNIVEFGSSISPAALSVARNGKISMYTGSNAALGTSAAMTAGTITISTTAVTASSKIFLSHASAGGTLGELYVGTITPGTSFVINSSSSTDTGTVNWEIKN